MAPALLTASALAPMVNREFGAHVPIPTLPLVTTKEPWLIIDVPIPTFPEPVSKTLGPAVVQPPTAPDEDQVAIPLLSRAVSTYPLMGVWPLIVKPIARTVP